MTEQAGSRRIVRPRRPRAVGLVASVLVFEALLVVALALLALLSAEVPAWPPRRADAWWLFHLAGVALGVLLLLAALGLLWMRPAAWLLAMAAQGLNLGYALVEYTLGQPDYVTMALGVIVVAALQQYEVRHAFQGRHG